MPTRVLAFLALAGAAPGPTGDVYHGRDRQLEVVVPRIDAAVRVDGSLDEPAWREAALLTGFSQFAPADDRPSDDSTEVLVWYSPTAIHFGIRAHEAHGAVRATLADRDRIDTDDNIQILLGTFHDGRQAYVFGVNPLGVQADGTLNEGLQSRTLTFTDRGGARDKVDLSADFIYQSRGRLTPSGFEVEVRIPFKSLRYQAASVQDWGINVVRQVKHSGYEDSWAPARRANASFLAQSGTLKALADLRRGLVLDLTPEVTQAVPGAPDTVMRGGLAVPEGWVYDRERARVGGTLRWGVTSNLTLNGTINPDFSQVEADAGQVVYDPRSALFFAERRPFFLDGIEQFQTPRTLIYTRRIVEPKVAAKLTGRLSGTNLAWLTAVDDRSLSPDGRDHPVFNLLRVTRDLGSNSRVGIAYTDRIVGRDFNRVADVDGRFVFGGLYSASVQGAASVTRRDGVTRTAPLWDAKVERNGRTFGFTYQLAGIDPDFRSESGFISRTGIGRGVLDHRYTVYGKPGSPVESVTGSVLLDGTWQYDRLVEGLSSQDRKLHLNSFTQLRGGWVLGASALIETFGYDADLYRDYAVEIPAGAGYDTVAYVGTPRLPNLDWVLSVRTPQFKHVSGNVLYLWGQDENFFEWASADIMVVDANVDWRPTGQLRVNSSYIHTHYDRISDGSRVGVTRIPRLKVEYQATRSIFFRAVGQYVMQRRDALRDEGRTFHPVLIRDEDGVYRRAEAFRFNDFRADWLFSYRPLPGTVVFVGYGSSFEPHEDRRPFAALERTRDGFFVKMSYLFRVDR
ncbi:MAG TPA: DUF5916 domain-containing protein [Gemmatimonadaceae bacterium]|nr:DUF5916 domain-containing protein [Gemmatimonadaceae bacterium]